MRVTFKHIALLLVLRSALSLGYAGQVFFDESIPGQELRDEVWEDEESRWQWLYDLVPPEPEPSIILIDPDELAPDGEDNLTLCSTEE